jgi:peroxiredoxin Q/BCP
MRASRARRWLLAAGLSLGLLAVVGCGRPAKRPDGGVGLLPVGSDAPEVVGRDVKNTEVRLSAQRGHATVVYFYPKDGTPGCTTEACAFRDAWTRYEKAHIAVIGVSSNSAESHKTFLEEKKLPFALAADESGNIAGSYGVGTGLFGYSRVTFLIDGQGKIARVWENVDPGVHATEVLAAAEALE